MADEKSGSTALYNSATAQRGRTSAEPKLSRLVKPAGMSLEEWQLQLRTQFGRDLGYQIRNLGDDDVFSDFLVSNPRTKRSYQVRIRGAAVGDNHCTCPDFCTNNLGTCKHIAFVLARINNKRDPRERLEAGQQPSYSEICVQYGARRSIKFRPGSECPPKLKTLARTYFDEDQTLRAEHWLDFDKFQAAIEKLDHEVQVSNDVPQLLAERRDVERRKEALTKAFPRGIRSAEFKNLLKAELYDYQREGALFAARAGRALIGDEMGLGKTIQAIAVAEIMARHLGVSRVLVICPTSLKHQWESELSKFTDRTSQVIGGNPTIRLEQFANDAFFKITNYDTVYRDLEMITEWGPDLVICDEAQRMKNWNTRTAQSVKQVQSPYLVVLTGTPLENRLEELVSIVEYIDKHRLGPTYKLLHDHQVLDEAGKVTGYKNLNDVGKTLEPLLIRRQKSAVAMQMPERSDKDLLVPMTEQQMKYHYNAQEVVARIVQKWQRFKFLSEVDKQRLMAALQSMRMSCNSTYLVDHETDYSVKPDEAAALLDEIIEQPDSKVVIFSQWLRTHELLQRRLKARDIGYVLFHGGVPAHKRKDLIAHFKASKECRVFLATDAGSVGLNLQHAQYLVNMDLPWNPAILEQRIARIHRLGQKNRCQIVNFIAQGTIEHRMVDVLKFKKSLFGGILDGGESNVALGGSRLTKFMDMVKNVTGSIPAADTESATDQMAETQPTNGQTASADGQTTDDVPSPTPATSPLGADMVAATQMAMLGGLMQQGFQLLEQLARPAAAPAGSQGQRSPIGPLRIETDAQTNKPCLKIDLPDPETLNRALQAVSTLLEAFRPR